MNIVASSVKKIKTSFSVEQVSITVLLLLGFVLRLRQYLSARSLWLDEAMLALNIVNRDFTGLFKPLDYNQGAPIGFLLIEKTANLLFGEHEFVLRFFPFLAGITSLILFYALLKITTSKFGLLVGLALFAVSPELIYYSSEVKQYIVDVGVSIGLILLAFSMFNEHNRDQNYLVMGIAGAVALWLSYSTVFILASIGVSLFINILLKRKKAPIRSCLMMGAAWSTSLTVLYFSSLQELSQNTFLLDYWQEYFMPIPPWSDWNWFSLLVRGLFQYQVGIQTSTWLMFIFIILGFLGLFSKSKTYASTILLIFVFALLASGLQLYPLGGRLSLFLAPLLILLISQSIDLVQKAFSSQYKLNKIFLVLVSVYLLSVPAVESFSQLFAPRYREHIRPTMDTLSGKWQDGDSLFVSYGASPAFLFYAERYGLDNVTFQTSNVTDYENPVKLLSYLDVLDGEERVWILFTHVFEKKTFNEKDYLLNYLDSIGNKKREFRKPGTGVHLFLYDLGQ